MTSLRWSLTRLACLAALVLIVAGCNRTEEVKNPPPQGGLNVPPMPGPPGPPNVPKPLEVSEPHAAGKKVYNENTCFRCHSMGGGDGPGFVAPPDGGKLPDGGKFPDGGKGLPDGGKIGGPPMPGGKGPDLAKVAAKGDRDAKWFAEFLANPKKDKPESKMPPFGDKIKGDDLKALTEFLASLK